MISFKNIIKGDLRDFSLEVREWEWLWITGNYHFWKNDILHILIWESKIESWEIKIFWKEIPKNSKDLQIYKRNFWIIFWDLKLIWSKSVFENLAYPLYLRWESDLQIWVKIEKMLKDFWILDKKNEYIHNLHSLEKAKISLARALITEPEILLFDWVHFSGFSEIMNILHNLKKSKAFTALFLTHDEELFWELDRIIKI